jgi:hypothetical protein
MPGAGGGVPSLPPFVCACPVQGHYSGAPVDLRANPADFSILLFLKE